MDKQVVKIGFLNYFYYQLWMGGVTYFMNLFQAMQTVRDPVLKPYIWRNGEQGGEGLHAFAEFLEKDELPYMHMERLPTAADYDVDIISHLQESWARDGIAWIADFQHKHLPELFDAEEIAKRDKDFECLAKMNRLVILSSDDALRDFKTFYPDSAHKGRRLHFVSIPEPGALSNFDAAEICGRLGIPERFFYVPNQFWKHKNHLVVFKAVARLKKRGVSVTVVCSGKTMDARFPGYFDELMAFCKAEGIEENVKILGLVDRKDVYFLQRQCVSLINPSRFEGWSSSVEEAKSVGKTIILSNLPVHIEQDPPEGRFFPLDDDERLAQIMEDVWNTLPPGPDRELERRARERLPGRIREFGEEFKKIVLEALAHADEAVAKPQSHVDAFVSNASNKDEFLHYDAIETIASTGFATASDGKVMPATADAQPDVTVVTVVRNAIEAGRLEELKQNVRSVARQKGVRVEHLIVDGASTDGTTDELKKMAADGADITLISESDHGIYDAMNKGVVRARGRYVAFLNSDDFYCDDEGLAQSVRKLDDAQADFSFAPIGMVDANGRPVVAHPHLHPTMTGIFTEMMFSHQSMLVRREVLLELSLFDTRYRSAADYDLILRLVIAGKKAVFVNCRFSTFRMGGFSQDNVERVHREIGDIYSRLYSKVDPDLTPERGYDLYVRKQPSPPLAKWFAQLESAYPDLLAPCRTDDLYRIVYDRAALRLAGVSFRLTTERFLMTVGAATWLDIPKTALFYRSVKKLIRLMHFDSQRLADSVGKKLSKRERNKIS